MNRKVNGQQLGHRKCKWLIKQRLDHAFFLSQHTQAWLSADARCLIGWQATPTAYSLDQSVTQASRPQTPCYSRESLSQPLASTPIPVSRWKAETLASHWLQLLPHLLHNCLTLLQAITTETQTWSLRDVTNQKTEFFRVPQRLQQGLW